MKLFVNGFWDGFMDRINPVHIGFFLDLFENVFACNIEISSQIDDCDILLESIFGSSIVYHKKWKYSFLFSGESRLVSWYKQYSCVLWGERNHSNVVNLPLFIPYLYCNSLGSFGIGSNVPSKGVCVIVSNGNGTERNEFMDKLEKIIPIEYCGAYKTNTNIINEPYHTEGFRQAISKYKFIITMENSREDTYITEKITHGFVSGIVPIYWGSLRVNDYFNSERFINIENTDDETILKVSQRIQYLCDSPDEYLKMVAKPVYSNERTMDMISRDIRNVIYRSNIFPFVSQIYIVSNPEFENDRCSRLSDLFYNRIGISQDMLSFISPTYKHTITDKMMNQNVKNNIIQRLRLLPMKKSEVSLFLNYKAVLESIERNYKDGMFLIFESDIILIQENFLKFTSFLKYIYEKQKSWDIIHIGYSEPHETFGIPAINSKTPYRDDISERLKIPSFIEDITNEKDSVRLLRKYHTRCTDSFVWNYTGVTKFLEYMNIEPCNTPFDYYMINKFETDENFKHYWTSEPFFIQGSNHGLDVSTIQNDTS